MKAKEVDCYCGSKMSLRRSTFGRFYKCTKRGCDGAVGVHADGKPLGIPAPKEVRQLRVQAHNKFDQLWKRGDMTRPDAYRHLRHTMGMTKDQAHIAKFNKEQLLKMISLFK